MLLRITQVSEEPRGPSPCVLQRYAAVQAPQCRQTSVCCVVERDMSKLQIKAGLSHLWQTSHRIRDFCAGSLPCFSDSAQLCQEHKCYEQHCQTWHYCVPLTSPQDKPESENGVVLDLSWLKNSHKQMCPENIYSTVSDLSSWYTTCIWLSVQAHSASCLFINPSDMCKS